MPRHSRRSEPMAKPGLAVPIADLDKIRQMLPKTNAKVEKGAEWDLAIGMQAQPCFPALIAQECVASSQAPFHLWAGRILNGVL